MFFFHDQQKSIKSTQIFTTVPPKDKKMITNSTLFKHLVSIEVIIRKLQKIFHASSKDCIVVRILIVFELNLEL